MAVCRGSDDLAFVFEDPFECFTSHKLLVKVGVKGFGEAVGIGAELFEGTSYFKGVEGRETIDPAVPGGYVDEDERISEATKGQGVAKDNVHVNFIKILAVFLDRFAGGGIDDCGEGAKCRREFARVDDLGVGRCVGNVILVTKTSTAKIFV